MIGSNDRTFINTVINTFTRDNDALYEQIMSIHYYMRGAMSRDDVWALTSYEREKYVDFLSKRFKDAGELMKKQVPVFI